MTFAELDFLDLVAFIALAKAVTKADHTLSPGEFGYLDSLADDIGRSRFDAAMTEAGRTIRGAEQALASAVRIQDPDKRYFLYERLVDLGETDFLVDEEVSVLERLAVLWNQLAPI